jgi:hypothetical protein
MTPDLETLKYVLRHVERDLDAGRKAQAAFVERFNANPLDALSWSKGTFEATARAQIAADVLAALTLDGVPALVKPHVKRGPDDARTEYNTLEALERYALAFVRRKASSPSYSTSPTSNLAESETLAAWAHVLEWLEG